MKVSRVEYMDKQHTQETIEMLEEEGWELASIAVSTHTLGSGTINEVALHFTKDATIADLARRK